MTQDVIKKRMQIHKTVKGQWDKKEVIFGCSLSLHFSTFQSKFVKLISLIRLTISLGRNIFLLFVSSLNNKIKNKCLPLMFTRAWFLCAM